MANNLNYTGGGRGSGGLESLPKAGGAGLGVSRSTAMTASSFATTLIGAWSSYDTAKTQAKMTRENNRHKSEMAQVQLSLNAFLSGRKLTEINRASASEQLQIQVGRMKAQSSINVQAAGSGNVSGSERLFREMSSSAQTAENARMDELLGQHVNIAVGRFNDAAAYEEASTPEAVNKPSTFNFLFGAGQEMIKIGQAATKTK